MSAHDDERDKLSRVSQAVQLDLPAILNSLQELKKREIEQENFDNAKEAKIKFDLITSKKLDFDRKKILEEEAKTNRNYKVAQIMETLQNMIIKEIRDIMSSSKFLSKPKLNLFNVTISGGGFHSMARLNDGKVVCWGRNDYKQCDVPADIQGQVKLH